MPFNFKNLTKDVRCLMEEEVNLDISKGILYYGKNLSQQGISEYPNLLIQSIRYGSEVSLATSLFGMFKEYSERRKPSGGRTYVRVPSTANQTLAEGEFNRFYIRALCRKALVTGKRLKVYRARFSNNPRVESENKIGTIVNADKLLNDLRTNIGFETVLGLPPGPNSGLSVELVD